ncbi:hypothetical protein IID23_02255 [Patescibacteria group bacterium]|nr:hypothetical protein [Patescibacteria group bacterium]
MGKQYALDENNDMILENGQFKTVDNGAEVPQLVRSRLLTYLEEWYLDSTVGVPYFQLLLIKPFDLNQSESVLKQTIIETEGVQTLLTFESTFERTSRGYTVQASFETIYGSVEGVTING